MASLGNENWKSIYLSYNGGNNAIYASTSDLNASSKMLNLPISPATKWDKRLIQGLKYRGFQ